MSVPTRVMIISSDRVHDNLAGPTIRAVEMARYLAQSCEVTLAAPRQADVAIPGVACVAFQPEDQRDIQHLAEAADVIIVQGFTLHYSPWIAALDKILVVDLYDPFHLEGLESESHRDLRAAQERANFELQVLNQQLEAGDFFVCASERQRDLWLGALSSCGRLSPESYRRDPTFRSLIDVVPFGLPPSKPVQTRNVLKGVVPGIGQDDIVVLWGGGIWDWLDPLTVIRAMAHVRGKRSDVKLFFLGQHHPNPDDVRKVAMYDRAVALAHELGLCNQSVFFNDRWVPYDQRANYLLEADLGVSAHLEHVETRFAFRTRLLDYIWAGLPMVVSAGDTLADTVNERGLGRVVAIGDAEGFAQAMLDLIDQPSTRQNDAPLFAAAQRELTWPQALQPLTAFCRSPRFAPDRPRQTVVARAHIRHRMDELEATVTAKNEHIVYLEGLIKQIESGRVMRLLQRLKRT